MAASSPAKAKCFKSKAIDQNVQSVLTWQAYTHTDTPRETLTHTHSQLYTHLLSHTYSCLYARAVVLYFHMLIATANGKIVAS